MKRFFHKFGALKGFVAGFLCAAMLLSMPAFADSLYTTIEVLWGKMQILINGEPVELDNFVYNGRTYVPLRAYSEKLGKSVLYDDATQSISIADREETLIMSKEIAFLVNGEAVRVSTFKQMLNWFKYNLELGDMDAETYAEFKEFVKQETVANFIVHQYSADVGINIGGAEKNAIESQIAIYANNFGGMSSFVKKLEDIGITYDFYYWLQETALLKDKLTDIIIDPVTELDIIDYYNKNIVLYSTKKVTAKQIFFSTTDDAGQLLSQSVREEKRKIAEDVLRSLKRDDADFDALMQQHSEDPSLAEYPDGYTFTHGEMVTAFEQAAFALQPGQMSELVESELGYHILLVTDRFTEYVPIENVQESIANSLRNERYYKFAEPQIQNAYILMNKDVYDSI
ncbi:MAG: peptidylprolyl isomerase [Clostridia bacterium]|nr:peptidylprolyl isomerase [Clostridia bacterium]